MAVTAELVHVVSIVRAAIVWVVVWIACGVSLLTAMLLLHVLALGAWSTRLLSSQCWVRRVVSAVLSVVSALALLLLTLNESRVIGAGTEGAASSLLGRTCFLLALCALLSVAAVVVLVTLFRCEILRAEVVRGRRESARLRLCLALLAGIVVLVRLRWDLLAKGIVWLLRGSRSL